MEKRYFCDMCERFKKGDYIKRRVDSPFKKSTHGKVCFVCPTCVPNVKEYNEAQEWKKWDRMGNLFYYVK